MRLNNKNVLITGAGSGIGRALAAACAEEGANLLLIGRRQTALRETRLQLPESCACEILSADVTDASARWFIREKVANWFGALDLLVNNAGVVPVGPLRETDDEVMERMLATNLLAPMALSRELLDALRRAAAPRIVNVGSVFGDIGHPQFAAYSASKFGLRGFSEAIRRELHGENIAVTYVAPRTTRTEAAAAFDHLIAPYSMTVDSAEVAAAQIMSAIRRDARSSYARGLERLYVVLQRFAPRVIDQALGRSPM